MAQKNLYISSPYLVPDPSILQSLKIAAMRNVDVRILIPQKADQGFTQWAAFSYFEELLGAGVRIFLYKEGFFHAKVISCDDKMCSIGTANLDIRSLKLNYEVNAIIYDEKITQNVAEQFHKDLEISREITLTEVRELAIHIKLRNSLARLISPVL